MNTVTTNETKKSDRIVSVLSTRDGSEIMRENENENEKEEEKEKENIGPFPQKGS